MPLPDLSIAIDSLALKLQARQWRMATAESCTGGLIAACCTDKPGASTWFEGSIVAYSNSIKTALLGVPPSLLNQHGAVSQAVALAMTEGVAERLSVDCAVAVTGIAGPEGATADKPVGLVWLARQIKGRPPQAQSLYFTGDRQAVRWQSAQAAIDILVENLSTI